MSDVLPDLCADDCPICHHPRIVAAADRVVREYERVRRAKRRAFAHIEEPAPYVLHAWNAWHKSRATSL